MSLLLHKFKLYYIYVPVLEFEKKNKNKKTPHVVVGTQRSYINSVMIPDFA